MKRGVWLGFVLTVLLAGFSGVVWGQSLEDSYKEGGQRYSRSDFQGALQAWQHGLTLARATENRQAEVAFLGGLGVVYTALGNYPQALRFLDQALQGARELRNRAVEGEVLTHLGVEGVMLNNLGNVYQALGDYPQALRFYEQALQIRHELKDRAGEGANLNNLSGVYEALGNYPQALRFLEQALQLDRELKDRAGEGIVLNNLGNVYTALGNYPQALRFLDQAL
ncbi:MAG: tetratricopeptide repeat protein, partial [Deltaproteobacteria bacterium]|nr:tetratricopeptide repeat protein [Deltaproteobacteria bacterium]